MLEVCPTCTDTSAQTAAPLADRGINDRLVELRTLVEKNILTKEQTTTTTDLTTTITTKFQRIFIKYVRIA